QALGAAGVHELAHHVAAAAPERRALDRVLRGLRRPQAEAVVMLRGENHRAEAAGPGRTRPLPGVELRGREDRRALRAVAPLSVGEGVDAEMEEQRQRVALPFELRR